VTAIRFAGSGGQGLQLAAVILAEAAVRAGLHAACTHTYGPESRGGASRADVLVGEKEIIYPRIGRPDVLVALSARDGRRTIDTLQRGGLLIVEGSLSLAPPPDVRTLALPIVEAARQAGSTQAANVVALGVLCAVTEVVPRDHLLAALRARLHGALPRNQRALDAGFALGREAIRGAS